MNNIRELCHLWSSKTFREGLNQLDLKDPRLYHVALECFSSLGLLDKKMNGYACEKLPKTEEGRIGLKVTFSTLFHNCIDNDNFSPVLFLVKIIEEFLASDIDRNKLNGTIARGLRTLTSLLREPDFAYNLTEKLKPTYPNVHAELNDTQDSADHTDVLLTLNGCEYRIWLFQLSTRGLPHGTTTNFYELTDHDLAQLANIVDQYWELRHAGLITEDVRNSDSKSPFKNSKDIIAPILKYFLFTGSGRGPSKFPADFILDYYEPHNPSTWHILDPSTAVDLIWERLIFSLRAKKGMPKDYDKNTYCKPNAESIGRWSQFHSGNYRGALHIRAHK